MANLIQKFRKWRREQKKAKQKQQSNMGFIRQLFRSQRGRYSSVRMAKEQKEFEFQQLNPGDNASLCSDVQIMDPNYDPPTHDVQDVTRTEKSDCVHYHVMDLDAAVDARNNRNRRDSERVATEDEEPSEAQDPLDNSDYYTKRAEQLAGDCGSNSMECLDVYFKPTEGKKSFRRSASIRKIKRAADVTWNAVKTAFDDKHKHRSSVPHLNSIGKAFGSR